ncbi:MULTISPECIES: glycosyltransferase family 39 protein [Geobacillus]|uniref:Glycosyltransferase family 39 protein n=1 Tax=Geobacillus zalihae TaxID=213419 RepID=A0A7H1RY69_9BACL|nr:MULTISPECIES: glycosyltransferase family 39 protein [Geobacillus]OQP17061.1 glycosyl transferase [Geobacillus zalihae]OQP20838.1 glycosyl transferase [Geobacillus zalihae]QNU19208.1 glycosyltransferase family 39 protein [Geobacillus zalihae]RXS89924.1 glycosyltransferase family 39 protein [Geobacillus sp. PK12]
MKNIKWKWDGWITAIMAWSAFLHFYQMGNSGSNVYYTAAAKSMAASWKAFFFAALDPEGFITVDKPPAALWLQALSVKVFGVSDFSVLLPEALAGVASTWMMYVIVKPWAGRIAARWASFIFSCTPVFVAVARTNNIDAVLVFTLLVAVWMLMKAVMTKRLAWLIGSFAVVGVGFNMKMLQAYMVLPAFYLFYWLAAKTSWKKRTGHLAMATVVLLAVSLSYAGAVALIPADKRPYIGGSKTNSVLELALGYNGIERLTGEAGPGGRMGTDFNGRERLTETSGITAPSNDGDNGAFPSEGAPPSMSGAPGAPPSAPGGGMGGIGRGEIGDPGVFRLFQLPLAGQASWLLPFVMVVAVGWMADVWRRRQITLFHRFLLFWLAWLGPMMVFFSIAGFYHRYYLSMLAPAIAVLVGAGGKMLASFGTGERRMSWLFPTALLATYAFDIWIAWQYNHSLSAVWPMAVGFYGLAIVCLWLAMEGRERWQRIVYAAALFGLLVLPAYWSLTPVLYGTNSTIPYAGPDLRREGGAMLTAAMPAGQDGRWRQGQRDVHSDEGTELGGRHSLAALVAYLEQHAGKTKYLAATIRATEAAEMMLHTDRAVMAMGGFGGTDPVLTPAKLEKMVQNGEVKYFLLSGEGRGDNELVQWIKTHCQEVPSSQWGGGQSETFGGMGRGGMTLYVYNG